MSTLYVSDLDGTLFNKKKAISEKSAEILNKCLDLGMQFAVATARMPYGCDTRLAALHMKTPGIVTNGVFLYDFEAEKIISSEKIENTAAQEVLQIFKRHGISCFLYMLEEGKISIYYDQKDMENQTQYYSERALQACREVKMITSLAEQAECGECVYLAYTGEKEALEPVCRDLDHVKGIKYSFYLNIYNGLYCLEIFGESASKRNALLRLKEYTGCDKIVVFGDNLNDISMIEIADESYAPANALSEVKEMVNGVLEDCDHDGVALFLENRILN